MRVLHYLVILAVLCGLAGLALEAQVMRRHSGVAVKHEAQERAAFFVRDVARLADNVDTLLIATDLVFGANESYLIPGARRQAGQLREVAEKIRSELDPDWTEAAERLKILLTASASLD